MVVRSQARLAKIARDHLIPNEVDIFNALGGVAQFCVTGGWVRDRLLDCTDVNPAGNEAWRRLRKLSGHPPGDIDAIVEGISARQFHREVKEDQRLCSLLRAPPVLVEAKGKR